MIVYGLQDAIAPAGMVEVGYEPGPVPILERARIPHLGDGRSDRSRTVWPHVFDVLHGPGRRWHMAPAAIGAAEQTLERPRDELVGLEVLHFLREPGTGVSGEAETLSSLPGGVRPEVTSALAAIYLDTGAVEVTRFQSRAEQRIHASVRRTFSDVGRVPMDRWNDWGRGQIGSSGDAMHASELPFLLSASVGEDGRPDLQAEADRPLEGSRTLEVLGWEIAVWEDRVVMVAAPAGLLQRHALHMLAIRAANAGPGMAVRLQAAAHPMRSRLWWDRLSGDPLVTAISDELAAIWDLRGLAAETFAGLEVVAQRDALDTANKQMQETAAQAGLTAQIAAETLKLQEAAAEQARQTAENTQQSVRHTEQTARLTEQATAQAQQAARQTRQADILNRILGGFAVASLILAALTFALDPTLGSASSKLRVIIAIVAALLGLAVTLRSRMPDSGADTTEQTRAG